MTAADPVYGKKLTLERQIAALNTQINGLATERKAAAGCVGYFFLPVGAIMLILGIALVSISGDSWPILVAIPELIIGTLCLRKTPSQEVVTANIQKQQQLVAERDQLQQELNTLE